MCSHACFSLIWQRPSRNFYWRILFEFGIRIVTNIQQSIQWACPCPPPPSGNILDFKCPNIDFTPAMLGSCDVIAWAMVLGALVCGAVCLAPFGISFGSPSYGSCPLTDLSPSTLMSSPNATSTADVSPWPSWECVCVPEWPWGGGGADTLSIYECKRNPFHQIKGTQKSIELKKNYQINQDQNEYRSGTHVSSFSACELIWLELIYDAFVLICRRCWIELHQLEMERIDWAPEPQKWIEKPLTGGGVFIPNIHSVWNWK